MCCIEYILRLSGLSITGEKSDVFFFQNAKVFSVGRDLVYSSTKIRKEIVPDYDKDVRAKDLYTRSAVFQVREIGSRSMRRVII